MNEHFQQTLSHPLTLVCALPHLTNLKTACVVSSSM
jgi:hypothetical protein